MLGQETLIKTPFRYTNLALLVAVMNKPVLAITLVVIIVFSIVAGILLFGGGAGEEGELYTYPLWVENETYIVTVRTNWTSSPEVSYFGLLKSVDVTFRGTIGTVSCNITVPNDLIWGEISVHNQDHKIGEDYYTLNSNSTHSSIQYSFRHIAAVEIINIMGTEGILAELITSSPSL